MRWVSRLVTGIVIAVVLTLAAALIRSRLPDLHTGEHLRVHALFRDGSRLAVGSAVVIAGVRIGDITDVSIEGRFARIDMLLRDDIQLPVDSFVTRRAGSLFGDSYIEIIPGTAGDGAGNARLLRPGDQIPHVEEGASTDNQLRTLEEAVPRLDNALDGAHGFLVRARQWVQGPMEAALTGANDWLAEGHVEGPLTSADRALERVERATASAAEALAAAVPEVDRVLGRADRALATMPADLADARARFAGAMRDVREGVDSIDPTIAQLVEVMDAIDRGEGDDWRGTLGRLANTSDLHDTLEDGTAALEEAAHGLVRFKSWLGARLEVGVFAKATRVYASAELRARNDKFYLVELERSALGGEPLDALADTTGSDAYLRTQEIRDRFRFTIQFGKQIRFLQLRGGIKDSTFGAGADVLLQGGRLRLSADVFGSFTRTPRLKVAAAAQVFRSVYVLAGVDDALNTPGYLPIETGGATVPTAQLSEVRYGRDYFVGGMLRFDDVDLAALLRIYGAAVLGLL